MIFIINAKYIEEYKILTTFNSGKESLVDLYETLEQDSRPIVRELLNKALFSQVKVDADTLVWTNGFDLAPEYVYDLAFNLCTA